MYGFCYRGVVKIFLLNPLTEMSCYRNQATMKVVIDKPYNPLLTLSCFGFPLSNRKLSALGAQVGSSSIRISKPPNNDPLFPWRGLHLCTTLMAMPPSRTSPTTAAFPCTVGAEEREMQVPATCEHPEQGTDCRQQPAVVLHVQ